MWCVVTYDTATLYLMVLEELLNEGIDTKEFQYYFNRSIGKEFDGEGSSISAPRDSKLMSDRRRQTVR